MAVRIGEILYLIHLKPICIAALHSVNGRSRIVIDNAMKRDDGTYMCVAENVAGLRRAVAAVRVKGQLQSHFRSVI